MLISIGKNYNRIFKVNLKTMMLVDKLIWYHLWIIIIIISSKLLIVKKFNYVKFLVKI